MADTPRTENTGDPRNGADATAQAARKAAEAARRPAEEAAVRASGDAKRAGDATLDAIRSQADDALRSAEALRQNTALAGEDVARANSDVIKAQLGAAEEAVKASMETSVQGMQDLARAFSRVWGLSGKPELAGRSAENLRAVSRATSVMAGGAQDASRAWLELAQKGFRTNLEAMSQLIRCRSVPELMQVQTTQARDNVQHVIESGELIVRTSARAIEDAARVMREAGQPTPGQ